MKNLRLFSYSSLVVISWSMAAAAGDLVSVPVRWCGVVGAASMVNPGVLGEATTDDVLWRRHERPSDQLYIPLIDMTFRSGATGAIKNGPTSFPIIHDVSGSDGNLLNGDNDDAIVMCRRAWQYGDTLYFDANANSFVNNGTDTVLSTDAPVVGQIDLGQDGASINPAPGDVRYIDQNTSGGFDVGEPIYRDENLNGSVDGGDTLLTGTDGTTEGVGEPADLGATLLPVPSSVGYIDLIRAPANTYNIGHPNIQGLTAVNAGDMDYTGIAFPVHGVNNSRHGVVMDDASQYIPNGFMLFEVQLVAHEFGHALTLPHGNGLDDNGDGIMDNEDDGQAPVPGAGPNTLCSTNNVMSYCWLDSGSPGMPDMGFIGVGAPTSGTFTTLQRAEMRDDALTEIPDRVVDPILPPMVATRTDALGDVGDGYAHFDIAEIEVRVDSARAAATFSIVTRRPFPKEMKDRSTFYFVIDEDRNPATGASLEALKEAGIPSELEGADKVGLVALNGSKVEKLIVFVADANGALVEIDPGRIRAVVGSVDMVPDFPMGRRLDPDRPPRAHPSIPSQTMVSLIFPIEQMRLTEVSTLRAEFITSKEKTGVIDRSSARYLDFAVPVFPVCKVVPETVEPGGTTHVLATGLLPNRGVHLLLGPDEVATGRADGDGIAQLALPIPADARAGKRLVTVGAIAVTADCTVNVKDDVGAGDDPDGPGGIDVGRAKYVMAAQFLCGPADRSVPSGMTNGTYETLVTLTNTSSKPVKFAKIASRAYPRQMAGPISDPIADEIPAYGAISMECDEIRHMLDNPMSPEFRGGTLLIFTGRPISGASAYSVRAPDGEVVSLQTEQLTSRSAK